MIQLLSVLIIHSSPFDEVAQGPAPPKESNDVFSLPSEKTIQVNQIQFSGNQAISTQDLDKIVSGYKNRVLSETDLQEIRQRVLSFYKAHGYSNAHVTIPKKQTSGTLSIVIVEGKKTNR